MGCNKICFEKDGVLGSAWQEGKVVFQHMVGEDEPTVITPADYETLSALPRKSCAIVEAKLDAQLEAELVAPIAKVLCETDGAGTATGVKVLQIRKWNAGTGSYDITYEDLVTGAAWGGDPAVLEMCADGSDDPVTVDFYERFDHKADGTCTEFLLQVSTQGGEVLSQKPVTLNDVTVEYTVEGESKTVSCTGQEEDGTVPGESVCIAPKDTAPLYIDADGKSTKVMARVYTDRKDGKRVTVVEDLAGDPVDMDTYELVPCGGCCE